ncbi:MAG: hypothetical protein AAFS10_21570, partial [Myxococcota bacterium]
FMLVEILRGVMLAICYGIYTLDHEIATVVAATLVWPSLWTGIVGTIKRFRDLNVELIYIMPVLMVLSAGFAVAYVTSTPTIGLLILSLYLALVLGVPSRHPQESPPT